MLDMFRALTCPSSGGQIYCHSIWYRCSDTMCSTTPGHSLPVESWTIWYQSDETRCCENTICPPEDGHVNARNMSRIVV